MAIDVRKFNAARPYLYHLTARENLDGIIKSKRILAASVLLDRAGQAELARVRRRRHLEVNIAGRMVKIRDQAPLHAGNISFSPGMTFEAFVSELNGRVFFWPGRSAGPIAYGVRHYERYASENPILVRVATEPLLSLNPRPQFCRYNSGSPRCSKGVGSPRGNGTFVVGEAAPFTPGSVVEVTFTKFADLPERIEVGDTPSGPWNTVVL